MTKEKLIKKYEGLLKAVINPDNSSWEDIGFDIPQEGYHTVEGWLEVNEDYDEGQQTEMRLYYVFLEDLKKLN